MEDHSQLGHDDAAAQPLKFHCTFPGCTKAFRRKEHLNRHARGHDSTRPFKCYLCNRVFSRKDILNRHVLQHNAPPLAEDDNEDGNLSAARRKRANVACEPCRRRKVKCNGDTKNPCSSCIANGSACVRRQTDTESQAPEDVDEDQHNMGEEMEEMEEDAQDTETPAHHSQYDRSHPTRSTTEQATLYNNNPRTADEAELRLSPTYTMLDNASSLPPSITYSAHDVHAMDDLMLWMDPANFQTSTDMVAVDLSREELRDLETFFHRLWPMIHFPAFNVDTATPALAQALTQVRDWVKQRSISDSILWDTNTSNSILQNFMSGVTNQISMSPATRTMSASSFQTLQALGLVIACAITGNNPPAALEWAIWCADICIAYLRQMGVFQGARKLDCTMPGASERWVIEEQFNRLAATFVRIDAYLSIMLNRAPLLRWPEMKFTLPSPEAVWSAATAEERGALLWHEPAGRSSTSFRTIIREGILYAGQTLTQLNEHATSMPRLPKRLLMEDYNLALCALYSDIWEVTLETRQHDDRSYRTPSEGASGSVAIWSAYILDLRCHMEMNYQIESTMLGDGRVPGSLSFHEPQSNSHDSGSSLASAINVLTLYHLLQLILFADIPVLETTKCCENCNDFGLSTRIQLWATSPEGRRAVVHCAQLRRLFERETIRTGNGSLHSGHLTVLSDAQCRISNPLRATALFYSAVVLCSFAIRAPCHHDDHATKVELAQPEVDGRICDELERWTKCDQDDTTGPSLFGTPLCHCSVPAMMLWYRDKLGMSSRYLQRLGNFEATLQL